MPLTISVISQKGRVGKFALARAIAAYLSRGGMNVLLADLDLQQGTAFEWARQRAARGLTPTIAVQRFENRHDSPNAGSAVDALLVAVKRVRMAATSRTKRLRKEQAG